VIANCAMRLRWLPSKAQQRAALAVPPPSARQIAAREIERGPPGLPDRLSPGRWSRLTSEAADAIPARAGRIARPSRPPRTFRLTPATVQEKAIAHPTDARLTHRAIEKLPRFRSYPSPLRCAHRDIFQSSMRPAMILMIRGDSTSASVARAALPQWLCGRRAAMQVS
jgi:hypothetical protein